MEERQLTKVQVFENELRSSRDGRCWAQRGWRRPMQWVNARTQEKTIAEDLVRGACWGEAERVAEGHARVATDQGAHTGNGDYRAPVTGGVVRAARVAAQMRERKLIKVRTVETKLFVQVASATLKTRRGAYGYCCAQGTGRNMQGA